MTRLPRQDIAIVGMSCTFPGAPDLASFAKNLREGRDAIAEVPSSRWEPVFHDPGSTAPDCFYCKRGGFIGEEFSYDAAASGLMPVAAEGAEPDQLLSLDAATRALSDAGYDESRPPGALTAVILGRGAYLGAGMARVDQHVRTSQQLVESLRGLLPGVSSAELEAVRAEFQSRLGHYGPDTAIGLVPNLAASRIANRLNFTGAAYTVDAACASSLLAVDQACRELRDGRADLALAGGVHLCHDVTFWSVFTQLGALSREGHSRPFDRRTDGLLIGEGIGLLALKRLSDAQDDEDRIYAVIKGTGVSSDGRGSSLMQPRVEGQVLALERAWSESGLSPSTIGLLEAHGTGTPAGDTAELTALARFFGPELPNGPGLGSVKSMIGHAMPAAGAAGLIKAALAIHHAELLPTLHCDEPHSLLAETGFRTLSGREAWDSDERRAGVSAFGFGGINAHVVLESAPAETRIRPVRVVGPPAAPEWPQFLFLAAASVDELQRSLETGRLSGGAGPARLALLDPSPERRARALEILRAGQAKRSEREGLWFSPRGLLGEGGSVAFLFPGVDAGFEPDVADVAEAFGLPLPPAVGEGTLAERGRAVVGASAVLAKALEGLGIRPDLIAGHSIGEWSGMVAAGIVSQETMDGFVSARDGGALELPGVVFAAAGCGTERAAPALEGLEEIAVSHDNCPHQIILCGRQDSVDEARRRLLADGVLCQELPFRSGFHSAAFTDFVTPHRRNLAELDIQPPRVPLWSATTCRPYPEDPDAIRELALEHLIRPVRFRELLEELHGAGVRAFVEVGGGRLSGFVGDTLKDEPHAVVRTSVASRGGLTQLARAAAGLWVEGLELDTSRLSSEPASSRQPQSTRLQLGPTLVSMEGTARLLSSQARPETAIPEAAAEHPLLSRVAENIQAIRDAQDEVMRAFRDSGAVSDPAPEPLAPRELQRELELSTETHPSLLDHCFYRQPPDWPVLSDRFPVLPLTTSLDMMRSLAEELVPGRRPVAIERVRAFRWLAVEPPVSLQMTARFNGLDRVDVRMGDFAAATVRFADSWPTPPVPALPVETEPGPVTAEALYEDRWMFHGPSFRGVRELSAVTEQGLSGVLEMQEAAGALLDNAGQLFGFWVMMRHETDRLAFPAKMDRLSFHGPDPPVASLLPCRVQITEVDPRFVRADLELLHEGRVWARIEGWEDRRFESDAKLWEVLRFPETEAFAEKREGGWCVAREVWRTPASRDLIARRYLGEAERESYEPLGSERRSWLLQRMAGKDAVRRFLWERGHGKLFPVEIELIEEAPNRPLRVRGAGGGLHVAVAGDETLAVALVSEGAGSGLGLERMGSVATDQGLSPRERELLPAEDTELWATRFRAAKAALAAAGGSEAGGQEITEAVDASRLVVDGHCVHLAREGDHVVAWTRLGVSHD